MAEDKKNFIEDFWQQAPHSRLLVVVATLVIVVLIVIIIYSIKFGRQSASVSGDVLTYATSPTSDTARAPEAVKEVEKAKEATKPADSKGQSKTQATPITISSDTSVKTIVNELKNIDLDELSSSVKDLNNAFGQFKN